MSAERDPEAGDPRTTVERASERELVIARTFDAPASLVFRAWTRPELFRLWWAPRSFGVFIVSHEADVRTGGAYRLAMGHPSHDAPMAFFGRYLDVTAPSRLVWTNEEGGEGGQVTTVTFEEIGAATRVVVQELYPSEAALDEAIASQSASGFSESFEQLDAVLAAPGAGAET